jgi:hypothetical protein
MNQLVNLDHREKMASLEEAVLSSPDNIDINKLECHHYFSHGLYTRELHIPAGVVITGKIHRHSNVNILSKGKVIAVTDKGRVVLEAPYTLVSGELIKKAIYAIEDAVWINCLPWDKEPSVDLVEEEYIVPTYETIEGKVVDKFLENT